MQSLCANLSRASSSDDKVELARRPKVADASNEWPSEEDLPSWGADDMWAPPTEYEYCNGTTVSVSNEYPTWELVLAKVLPDASLVTPASAAMAPRGGCDNLCNDEERYTDTIEFRVSSSNGETPEWLLIRTEDCQWNYKIVD